MAIPSAAGSLEEFPPAYPPLVKAEPAGKVFTSSFFLISMTMAAEKTVFERPACCYKLACALRHLTGVFARMGKPGKISDSRTAGSVKK